VPVFDEVQSLPILWQELETTLAAIGRSAEVIFVDDGSTDGSAEVLRGLARHDARVRVIRFEGNAGLSAAFHAGYHAARGRIIASMDSDLQSDAHDLIAMLAALDGVDAVVGWRQVRHDSWVKRVSSRVANVIRDRVTGDRVRDSACSLRVLRRECVAALLPFNGMHRFVPTLLRMAGHAVRELPVHHRARRFGRSKFGVSNRAVRASLDLMAVRWMMARRLRYRIAEEIDRGHERR
jgi:glycosyltransferase involved in cell wall biosynthesis